MPKDKNKNLTDSPFNDFQNYVLGGGIDKPLSSGGPGTARVNLDEVIKIADKEKIEFDALNDRLELLREAWLEQREPGESYNSWFNRTSKEDIIRLTLGSGGKVIKFTDYYKPKKIHKINLSDYFELGKTVASLSDSERETIKWLLDKTLNPKK